jgi:hypothetical protein
MVSDKLNKQIDSPSNEASLKELFLKIKDWYEFLSSKWLLICGIGIIGALLGLTYAFVKRPVYTAATTFVLEEDKAGAGSNLGALAGLASIAGVDLGGGGGIFQGDNILALYKSRTMIEKTLLTEVSFKGNRILLVDCFIDFNDLRKQWKKKGIQDINFRSHSLPNKAYSSFTRLQDSLMGTIVTEINKKYLSVAKPDKKLSIISVEVKSENEFFAKEFNSQIVKNVNDFYIQTKTKKSLENVAILQQKTDSVRAVMNGAIYAAAAVTDATPNLNPTRQIQRIAPVQRSQFSAETNKAILGELVKNLEMSKISLRKETPLIQVVDEPVYPLFEEHFGKLKGIIIGGFLASFLTVFFLFIRKIVDSIIHN